MLLAEFGKQLLRIFHSDNKHLTLFFLSSLLLLIAKPLSANILQQRDLFIAAEKALDLNQLDTFQKLLNQLDDYPIKAYLEYEVIKMRLDQVSLPDMSLFLAKYRDFPFSKHLRVLWLKRLANEKRWRSYLLYFDQSNDTVLQCLNFTARIKMGFTDNLYQDIQKIWLNGYSQPSECDTSFAYYLKHVPDVEKQIWLRIEKAFKARRSKLARYLAKKLSKNDQKKVELWYQAHLRPEKTLKQLKSYQDEKLTRKIIVHALDRLARKDSLKAKHVWQQVKKQFKFNETQKKQLRKRIALSAALQHLPEAKQLLADLPAKEKNDAVHLWLARINLRDQDWPGLIEGIKQMPERLSRDKQWKYWQARALESTGFSQQAKDKFMGVAQNSTYYGFLAADKINVPYIIIKEKVTAANFDEDLFLQKNIHLLRARELYFVDRITDARREWFQGLRQLETNEIKQAASMASGWKWHEGAIKTVARTTHRRDYDLRFPMPFKKQVLSRSRDLKLDPSIIYSVMRRESLFDPLARSPVGALGLMQLMPATARFVSRQLGLKRPGKADILNIETNIKLGTSYFRRVLNRFDNNVSLAAAAYNAGPSNVRRWLPKSNVMPADLWVETVPYRETRNYVQAVLAYATIFDKARGQKVRITSRMDDVRTEY